LMGPQIFPDDILLIRDGHNVLRLGADAPRPIQQGDLFVT